MKILITGGTGMIGEKISQLLLQGQHEVIYLSRNPKTNKLGIKEYGWDIESQRIDLEAFKNVDAIISLAGAAVNKRWTPSYKSQILRSRVDSTRLLFNSVQKLENKPKTFISASGVGYYKSSLSAEQREESPAGNDFLANVCKKWEHEADNFQQLGLRIVKLRIGVVLSNTGGALPIMAQPIKLGIGSSLAGGKQWIPWIHIDDLAQMFVYALENNVEGAYNAAGAYNVTNAELTKAIATTLKRPLLFPPVPAFALKLILGEMADTAINSYKVNTQKIQESGFAYHFTDIKNALANLLNN